MRKIQRLVYIIMLMLTACTLVAREKRALAVGIGVYQDPVWEKIHADNDLAYVGRILDMYGFTDITFLRNEQATKAEIVKAFDGLMGRCSEGDVIYIHFSGHGQQVRDLSGDETDGYDEAWIPYDAYRKCCPEDDGSRHLVDDEINVMLAALRDKVGRYGQILVIVDACHSGNSSRMPKSNTTGFVARGVSDIFVPSAQAEVSENVAEDWILISACEDYQVNFEVRKPSVGKLTYAIYKLRKVLPIASNEVLLKKLVEVMNSPDFVGPILQNPRFDGNDHNIKDVFKR